MAAGDNNTDAPKALAGDASPADLQSFIELDPELELDPFVREARFNLDS